MTQTHVCLYKDPSMTSMTSFSGVFSDFVPMQVMPPGMGSTYVYICLYVIYAISVLSSIAPMHYVHIQAYVSFCSICALCNYSNA